MRQKEISTVINKSFKSIEGSFHKMTGSFEMEPIHEFRTGVKKLRAFIRLVNVAIRIENKLKLSKNLKALYGYAGTIRNLQLQLKDINYYTGNPQYTALEGYADYLKKIIEKWKAEIIELAGRRHTFHLAEKEIIKSVPEKLRKDASKKFLCYKIDDLANSINDLRGDETLHNIRKLLKDITYNWAFLKTYHRLLPLAFSTVEKIKSFTELIGVFLDKGIAIILLETYCKDCEENGFFIEKDIKELQVIEREWENQKAALGQIIYVNPCFLLVEDTH